MTGEQVMNIPYLVKVRERSGAYSAPKTRSRRKALILARRFADGFVRRVVPRLT
jgi:hypothetical protein